LWGADTSPPLSPQSELATFLQSHGWPDFRCRVPHVGNSRRDLRGEVRYGRPIGEGNFNEHGGNYSGRDSNGGRKGDADWVAPVHAALSQLRFAVTTPVLSPDVADSLRAYVFRLAHAFSGYHSERGCVGDLDQCNERFDMRLRFSPEVTAAANQFVAALRPVLAATLGEDAELVEMAAMMTCRGAPEQHVHADGHGRRSNDGLISSLIPLQVLPFPCFYCLFLYIMTVLIRHTSTVLSVQRFVFGHPLMPYVCICHTGHHHSARANRSVISTQFRPSPRSHGVPGRLRPPFR